MSSIDEEQAEGGYLVSVSDLMSGLVFIFMITLVSFIINFQDASNKIEKTQLEMNKEIYRLDTVKNKLDDNEVVRANILETVQNELEKKHDINVNVDITHGVLRLNQNSITFDSGSAELDEKNLQKLLVIKKTLEGILPCFSVNLHDQYPQCKEINNKDNANLESVFIEGHTDNTNFINDKNGYKNWQLSVNRAIKSYMILVDSSPILSEMKNENNEAVFSVSGYGSERPLPNHRHQLPTFDAANRRIDLRFIMTPPSLTKIEKELIKKDKKESNVP